MFPHILLDLSLLDNVIFRRKTAISEQNVRISDRYGLKSTKCSDIGAI